MLAAYQAATDLLCLSVPSFPLALDFAMAVTFTVPLPVQAAESLGPSALNPDIPRPQAVEVRLVLGSAQRTSGIKKLFSTIALHAADAAVEIFHVGVVG